MERMQVVCQRLYFLEGRLCQKLTGLGEIFFDLMYSENKEWHERPESCSIPHFLQLLIVRNHGTPRL